MNGNLCNEVLVSYDIEDNKDRLKLANELKDLGLESIQKSVMWGYLLPAEEKNIYQILKKYCKTNDKAFYTRVNIAQNINQIGVGYNLSAFEKLNSYEVY